jgi:hypothetical protein
MNNPFNRVNSSAPVAVLNPFNQTQSQDEVKLDDGT